MNLRDYCHKQKFRFHHCTMDNANREIKHDIDMATAHISYENLERYEYLRQGDFT